MRYFMRVRSRTALLLTLGSAAVASVVALAAEPAEEGAAPPAGGAALYDRYCLACHGAAGDGNGPAAPWLHPKPRDLTRGRYKWRSTGGGKIPTDADLARVIREGAPGTSMPAFAGILDAAQVDALVAQVKSFAPKRFAPGGGAKPPAVVTVPPAPADLAARAPEGKELFGKLGCAQCHGPGGKGDGPTAPDLKDAAGRPAPPFDFTSRPLRRGGGPAEIYLTLVTGLDGTPMAAFDNRPADELWALVAYVDSIRARAAAGDPTAIDPSLAKDKVVTGLAIDPQGAAPEGLPPAVASLSSAQCGRCHAKQLREWTGSIHGAAAGPGLLAQLAAAKDGAKLAGDCQPCHAPLAEQMPAGATTAAAGATFDPDLRAEGITCAACHVRGWTRRGPPRRADSALLPIDSYPFAEDPAYERADFCLPCHQSSPSGALNGKPMLNTWREWLEGPYMRAGVQCQHCHMPDREHTWKGVHDPETVRQGVKVTAVAGRAKDGAVTVKIEVTNAGAGHYLPTTPTPAAYLTATLVGGSGASSTQRIGRHLEWNKKWKELADTRIPPGETLTFSPSFTAAQAGKATAVDITLRMEPDEYYERFYQGWLARKNLAKEVRADFQTALDRAQKSEFVVWQKTLSLKR